MSVAALSPVSFTYFGKIPSRGDFVRSPSQAPLIHRLDQWLSQGLQAMAQDARWKSLYDQAPPVNFAFLNPGSPHAMAGHLVPSADQSGRRFPLVTVGTFAVAEPAAFLPRAPLAISRLWAALETASLRMRGARESAGPWADEALWPADIDISHRAHEPGYLDFLQLQTVGSLQQGLQAAGHALDLRLSILALGLLLEAVPSRGRQPIDKGLCLPLPQDALQQPCVAAFWLDLVSKFIAQRTDLELALYLPQVSEGQAPALFLGFAGGAPAHFSAMLDARAVPDCFVDIRRAAWAQAHAEQTWGARKLSNYLRQPQLSLLQASRTFCEAFLGQ